MEFIYKCKKNGLEYVYTTELENLTPQDAYAWRRGVREYADNYHASVTKDGLKKGGNTIPWDNVDDYIETVTAYCDEAHEKFHAGDVPGERESVDPKTLTTRLAKRYNIEPGALEKWLDEQARMGRAA